MGQIHPDVWENKGGRVEPGTEENTKQTFSLCSEGVCLMQQPAPSTETLVPPRTGWFMSVYNNSSQTHILCIQKDLVLFFFNL